MTIIHLTQNNFHEEVLNSKIPVIIDFWAPWCGPCQLMGPLFEELSYEYKNKLKFAKLNIKEEPALANQFQIQGIPSLSIVYGTKEIDRIVGLSEKNVIKQKINSILTKLN